jgi:hypothetical protein
MNLILINSTTFYILNFSGTSYSLIYFLRREKKNKKSQIKYVWYDVTLENGKGPWKKEEKCNGEWKLIN